SGHKGAVNGLALSPDGKVLVSTGVDGMVRLWNLATFRELRGWQAHKKWGRAVAFHPDGKELVSAGDDGKALLWDVATGKLQREVLRQEPWVLAVAFSPDGKALATGGRNTTSANRPDGASEEIVHDVPQVSLWDLITGKRRAVDWEGEGWQ